MLKELHIRNFAIIEELSLSLDPGLTVITGETGAGKSILVEALGLLLGGRASPDVVRLGTDRCRVEGLFDLSGWESTLKAVKALGVETEGELVLCREVSSGGRSRCYINGRLVPLHLLKAVGEVLVDIHGQHEHQALLREETHIGFLDRFGGLEPLVGDVGHRYEEFEGLRRYLQDLKSRQQAIAERRELYAFQLREIEEANLQPGEMESLERERGMLENAGRLLEAASGLIDLLYEGEDSVAVRLGEGLKLLEEMAKIDPSLKDRVESYRAFIYEVEDIADFLREYIGKIEADPERLEEVRERLDLLKRLIRKYGGSEEAVLKHRDFLKRELEASEGMEEEIKSAECRLEEARRALSEACRTLSDARREAAEKLSRAVEDALFDLGMRGASFRVHLEAEEDPEGPVEIEGKRFRAGPSGIDICRFYLAANPGEGLRPLAHVASGGEMSRIMLALKSILADVDAVPTAVFDEVDIGISGRTADAVGRKLKAFSRSHQVLSVTHLPQIARMADLHLVAKKRRRGGRTVAEVFPVEGEERIRELARLLSGGRISPTARRHAEELLKEAGYASA